MKKIIRLTENDLTRIVKKVLNENPNLETNSGLNQNKSSKKFTFPIDVTLIQEGNKNKKVVVSKGTTLIWDPNIEQAIGKLRDGSKISYDLSVDQEPEDNCGAVFKVNNVDFSLYFRDCIVGLFGVKEDYLNVANSIYRTFRPLYTGTKDPRMK